MFLLYGKNAADPAERAYTQRKAEVEQTLVEQLSHEEMVWKLQGFPKDSMPEEGDPATGADLAYTQLKTKVLQKSVEQLSREECLWKFMFTE